MAHKYTVVLIRKPNSASLPDNFFPRGYHYKADALRLIEWVKARGGEAKLKP